MSNPNELLDTEAVARLLNVSIASVINYTNRGNLPAVLIGRRYKYKWPDVERFIDSRKVA
jgi:hypothetical protein